ncbi:MAG TPA: DUF3515 family protein [Micromonospora sp.]
MKRDDTPKDPTTRQAALWATLVAVPLTALVAFVAFAKLNPDDTADPAPSATASPRPVSTAPVASTARQLTERQTVVCRALLSRLPTNLRDLAQRPVQAGPEQNAAYGDPPLTLACGVPQPSVPATDDRWMVNKVCWHAAELADATVLTTLDREVPVRVTVPRAYTQPLQWVAPVSESLVSSVPSVRPAPTGCTG